MGSYANDDHKPESLLSKYLGDGGQLADKDDAGPHVLGGLVVLPASVAAMLDLRFKTGNRLAIPYGYILSVALDPSKGIQIRLADMKVIVTGRVLGPVYAAIVNHTALAIEESVTGFDEAGDSPFIESIRLDDGQE